MISIVMAARNYARYLPMAVESALAQTFRDWEMIIVDDGSTDETCEVVKPFLKDSRIRYYRSDRLGQSRAKNLGVRLSTGENVAFLDADDAWRPTKLEHQIAIIEGDSSIGVVATERELISEKDTSVGARSVSEGSNNPRLRFGLCPVSRDAIFISNPICFSSTLMRREAFDRVGGFDESLDLSIDYDLWLRLAEHYSIVKLDEPLTLYRTGHGNLSSRQADRIATAFTIMNRRRDGASRAALNEGYGSTWQSLAWFYRSRQPFRAITTYLYALTIPHGRLVSLKGAIASSLRVFSAKK